MTTQTVRHEVLWAVVAMEAAIALPIMTVIAPGEGNERVLATFLLLLLLPGGFAAMRWVRVLREPAWRVLAGFALVVALRLPASLVPGEGAAAAMARFLQAVVPASLAFALWWRGGTFADMEMVAADVHLEFLLGGCALLLLQLVFHGLVAVDPQVLVWSAGLFVASSTVALALARQDAADAASLGGGRMLGATMGLLPIGITVVLLMILRPDVMSMLWQGLARLLELALMPLLLLLSWLASLLPAGAPVMDARPPPRPFTQGPSVDELARQQQPPEWIPYLALALVLLVVLLMAAGILRLLLESQIVIRPQRQHRRADSSAVVEGSGGAGQDARQLLGWLAGWLRRRLLRTAPASSNNAAVAAADAWSAYRTLLEWAAQHGIQRRAPETTQQLQARILAREPRAAEVVDVVTETFESERYGAQHPPADRLRRVQAAVRELFGSM
jgi:Domain of unknown function (DUF4129)